MFNLKPVYIQFIIYFCIMVPALPLFAQMQEGFYSSNADLFRIVQTEKGPGLLSPDGKIICEGGDFDSIAPFVEGLALVSIEDKYGYIDIRGQLTIEATYSGARDFSEGLAAVKQNGQWGYIDRSGNWMIDKRFDKAMPFVEGYASVKINEKYGLIDRSGEFVLNPEYESILGIASGLASVTSNKRAFHVQIISGKRVYPENIFFEQVRSYSEGLAPAQKNGKWGYINISGEFVVPPTYDRAGGFSEGIASVYKNDAGWGFIDREGHLIADTKYKTFTSFKQGRTIVFDNDSRELLVLDFNGRVIDRKKWGPPTE